MENKSESTDPMEDDPQPSPKPSPASSDPPQSGLTRLWAELKRRHVVRVAMVYAIVGWLVIQVANATFSDFGIPTWAYRFVVLMVVLGFPISLVVAWAFELTPEGIKTSKTAREEHPEAHKDSSVQRKRNWFTILLAAGLPTAIFGALALFFYFSRSAPNDQDAASLDISIAVLPLTNMSPDPENAFFADGVQEDILTNLSKIDEFRVISRTSTLQYRDTVKTMTQISEELEVRYLVEGSVRRAGDQVLVTVQLIDTKVEQHIWAESYNRKLDDIFAIQAAVAKEIAGQLHIALSPEEIEKIEYRPTENQEAYDAYVQARQLRESGSKREAREWLKKAVSLDSDFAEAWALLTYNDITSWNIGSGRETPELLETARTALAEAIRLAPDTPAVLFARSTYLTHFDVDLRSAIQLLQRAVSIDPNYYIAQWELAILFHILGQLSEAQIHFESALLSDPLSNRANEQLVAIYEKRGMWKEARSLIQKNVERSDRRDWWQLKLAQTEFLQTGNKQPLVSAWESKLHPNDAVTELLLALEARDYPRTIAVLENEKRPESNFSIIHSNLGWWRLKYNELQALAWFELGDLEKARIANQARKADLEARETVSSNDFSKYWSELALINALEGSPEKTEEAIEKSRDANARSVHSIWNLKDLTMRFSLAYLVLGENEKAIDTLEQASGQPGCELLNRQLQLWPFFDRLRGNPRFDKLLED